MGGCLPCHGSTALQPESFREATRVGRGRTVPAIRKSKSPAEAGLSLRDLAVHPGSDRDSLIRFGRLAQHVAAAPDRLDVVLALAGVGELLAQLADEDVDDLQLGLVHAAVEMVEEHLLRQRR